MEKVLQTYNSSSDMRISYVGAQDDPCDLARYFQGHFKFTWPNSITDPHNQQLNQNAPCLWKLPTKILHYPVNVPKSELHLA